MAERKVHVPNISCNHCKMTIERELGEIRGVEKVFVDVGSKQVVIRWDKSLLWEDIVKVLKDIGYPPGE